MTSTTPPIPSSPDRDAVLKALEAVTDPLTGQGLTSAGLVRGLALRAGRAGFMLEVRAEDLQRYEPVRAAAEAALMALPGVSQAQVVLTTETLAPTSSPPPRSVARTQKTAPLRAGGPKEASQRPPFVQKVIAVASAKGGVGKSTVAVNLAAAFAALGYRTGLLDADVYGPSVPKMLRLSEEPQVDADKKLVPLIAYGVKAVSIGLLVKEGAPMIWRGPMASSALTQLLNDVAWGSAQDPLELLIIDMPPGTGDIQLTLAQKVTLDGAVIVSTPQEVALIDVRRGVAMFQKTAMPILGVVENMAYFPDPRTGEPIEIFGRGGARKVAEEVGAPFLGEIPIDIDVRRGGDVGEPIVTSKPSSASAAIFIGMAEALAERLKDPGLQKPPPSIRILN